MINKYHKKSIEVTAVQWDGTEESYKEICDFMDTKPDQNNSYPTDFLQIDTLEGVMKASVGDYIIKGVKGEFYPCKPDIFNQTYINLNGTPPQIIPAIDFKTTVQENEKNIVDAILIDINKNLAEIMNGTEYPKEIRYTQSRSSVLITVSALEIVHNILSRSGYSVRMHIDRQSELPILIIDLEKTIRG